MYIYIYIYTYIPQAPPAGFSKAEWPPADQAVGGTDGGAAAALLAGAASQAEAPAEAPARPTYTILY